MLMDFKYHFHIFKLLNDFVEFLGCYVVLLIFTIFYSTMHVHLGEAVCMLGAWCYNACPHILLKQSST